MEEKPNKDSESIGCLGWVAIATVIIGLIISATGVGAGLGLPVVGIGSLGWIVFKVGLNSWFNKGCAVTLLVVSIIVLILIAIMVSSLFSMS